MQEPNRVPAASGFAWMVQGLALLRREPGRLLLIAVVMQLLLGLTQVPLLGLLFVIAVPGLTAGILEAFRSTERGQRPAPGLLFRPLASGKGGSRLLLLGAIVFAVGMLAVALLLPGSEQMPGEDLMNRIQQGDVEAIAELDPAYLYRLVLAFAVSIAISGTISYFAIPLIWFGRRPVPAALGDGLKALLVNWKPFLALALGLVVVLIPVSVIAGLLLALAAAGGLLAVLAMSLIMILALLYQLLLFATQYCSYREIFGFGEDGPAPAGDDGQLLA